MKITRTEIKWMLNLVEDNRENSKILKDMPGQKYAKLHELEYENMRRLAKKLETILNKNSKRVEID